MTHEGRTGFGAIEALVGAGIPRAGDPRGLERLTDLRRTRWSHDPVEGVLRIAINAVGVPRADFDLLGDMVAVREATREANEGRELTPGQPVRYLVIESACDRAFGLGGDLALLADLVEGGDVGGLGRYADLAAEVCSDFADGMGASLVTIALVRGAALGGMFEAARSCDVLVAEEGATFALPEVAFGLFPGAGAISALAPRIGYAAVTNLMRSGRTLDAREARDMGIVDVLAPPGEGTARVAELIGEMESAFLNAHAVYRGVSRSAGITRERYLEEAASWARHALRSSGRDVGRMRRLARVQDRSFGREGRA